MKNSKIEWTDHTFNPWVGCKKVSPACANCYAEAWAKRAGRDFSKPTRTTAANWREPLKWNRQAEGAESRQRVFCASLADVFDNRVPVEWRADLWALIQATPRLDWLIVTKRIGNAARMLPDDWGDGWPNVWLLSTIADQGEADRDIPKLLATPARVRGLSIEPLLSDLSLVSLERGNGYWLNALTGVTRIFHDGGMPPATDMQKLDWVIVGGESGSYARPMNPAWVRSIRDQCQAAGVSFFFKQWGEFYPCEEGQDPGEARQRFGRVKESWPRDMPGVHTLFKAGKKKAGRTLDGRTWDELPEVRPCA